MSRDWPSREEWAKRQRTIYYDMEIPRASSVLTLYASEAEIAAAIAELERCYRELGVHLKRAKHEARGFRELPGETHDAYVSRWRALSRAEKNRAGDAKSLRCRRHAIRAALKSMRAGVLWNGRCRYGVLSVDDDSPLIAEISRRYKAACDAKFEEFRREVESTPIDDEAWQRELEWRARIDAGPFVHKVGG